MPQLDPEFWGAQIFWLILIFSTLLIIIWKVFLPKITHSIENRKSKIVNDLNEAQKLKESAEKKLREYQKIIDDSKKDAKKIISDSKKNLEQDINILLDKVENERDEIGFYGQWGIHKNLWTEINHYIDYLLSLILNKSDSVDGQDEDSEDNSTPRWMNSPNQWQIGNLSYTYWARIHPEKCPLGKTYGVGFAVTRAPILPWLIIEGE